MKKRQRRKVDDFAGLQEPERREEKQWWDRPPRDIEGMLHIISVRAYHLKDETPEGDALREILARLEDVHDKSMLEVKNQYPIAFFKPSYEQALLLNAWIWGIDFVVCLSANRIGKTAALGVINPSLYIVPNNPEWEMFAARLMPNPEDNGKTFLENPYLEDKFYYDLYDRPVQILQRPRIEDLDLIRFTLRMHPELAGDPTKSHLEDENADKFARLQELCPSAFNPAWPAPSIQSSGTIWLGAPDNDFHRDVVLKEWKRWLPSCYITKWSDSDLFFEIDTNEETNPCPTVHRVICKSYESDDTKWSGSAVRAIILTEGFSQVILNEVKQRIVEHGFASWDYTPYEARNVGSKTALAFKVHKGEEQLPLHSFIFTRFSARKAPDHILPTSKRDDLIRMWDGKAEGDARLDGIFYSSSPLILAKLDRSFHCVPWSVEEMFERYPTGQIYRGLDPGYDHPTVCVWGYLVPGNIWFIYRYYVERAKTISQRCMDIVKLSNNELKKEKLGKGKEDYILREIHTKPNSEPVILTAADYHMFHADETTGQNYALNYNKGGLVVTESTHMKPEDRAIDIDNKLDKSEYHTHPVSMHTPGSRIFFLVNGHGVDKALAKMESLFWDRLAGGPNKGEAKDKVPLHNDDELDATCYLVCGPYVWTPYTALRINGWVDEEDLEKVA